MLIYQKLKGKWNREKRSYEFPSGQERILYRGKLAYAKGGGGGTEVVATGPSEVQLPYVNMLMDQAFRLFQGGPPQYYPGQLTASPNSTLLGSWDAANRMVGANNTTNNAVQSSLLGSAANAGSNPVNVVGTGVAPTVQSGVSGLIGGQNAALGAGSATAPQLTNNLNTSLSGQNATQQTASALTPSLISAVQGAGGAAPGNTFGNVDPTRALDTALNSNGINPYTDAIIKAALRSSNENFSDSVMPQIRTSAGAANQTGGTRQGIAEGIATKALANQQGDIISRLYGQAFDTGSADRNAALNLVASGQNANQNATLAARGLGLQGAQIGANLLTQGTAQGLQAGQQAGNLLTQGSDISANQQIAGTGTGANLLTSGNNAAMEQYFRSLGLIPQVQANQMAQLGFQNQSGLQQYGIQQAGIDSEIERYFYNTLSPYNALTQFQNYISGSWGSSLPEETNQRVFPTGYQSTARPNYPNFGGFNLGGMNVNWPQLAGQNRQSMPAGGFPAPGGIPYQIIK